MILFNLKFITSKNYCLLFSVSNKPAQCPVVTAHCAAVLTQHPQSLCSSLSEVLGFRQSLSSHSLPGVFVYSLKTQVQANMAVAKTLMLNLQNESKTSGWCHDRLCACNLLWHVRPWGDFKQVKHKWLLAWGQQLSVFPTEHNPCFTLQTSVFCSSVFGDRATQHFFLRWPQILY